VIETAAGTVIQRMFSASRKGDSPPQGVTFLDHTADLVLEATGPTLEACFARMGAGLFAVFAPPPVAGAESTRLSITLSAPSPEELLVGWLEELLYRSDVDGLVFSGFETELNGDELSARVSGRPLLPGEELRGPSVKAVTRHDLRLEPGGEGWLAQVVLDL
jgi:SHS2 domain-containing protein